MLEKVHRPQLTRVVQSKEFGYLESDCSEKKGFVGGIKKSTICYIDLYRVLSFYQSLKGFLLTRASFRYECGNL